MALASIRDTIAAIGRGEMIILVDDEARENEGDLVVAAEAATPEAINFMAKWGRGLICLSLTDERLRELQIPPMVQDNSAQFGTAFTVSVEARDGVTTGISAADRARTIAVAIAEETVPADLVRPGHVFPLRAQPGGVLVRTGQTEGSVDLARLAGLKPAAVICEILNDDGTMARMADLEAFAAEHGLLIASVADLIRYRLAEDTIVERLLETPYPCEAHPDFRLRVYRDLVHGGQHFALVLGDPAATDGPVPIRVQHEALIGDVFRGTEGGCGWQVHGSMQAIAEAGVGVLVYLQSHEFTRLDAVARFLLDPEDAATLTSYTAKPADINRPRPEFRDFGIGAQILVDCGVRRMNVLMESRRTLVGLDAYGLEVVEPIDIPVPNYRR
ncbi:MAG: 3,4-dihydroxy-2-butanone-4-phosphate synthase [Myxococcales bacterium]|nr:3,4-dihydroxy-2-butanone-4-phosphate synthase [Myxococcales bacterium]MCB9519294.1 3,4-dihydroxy-2-butanone-4-phosphate synthase [Myxococcales bacterium]MCB9530738.1 3,4-dihydroxy-2-butanone-4-phosphate synthase [Myxococcales bacterium]MCB9533368.1 3,4-dihydroxy-2-butanone-4-phosphate synthase [Myxococcales bacterium]